MINFLNKISAKSRVSLVMFALLFLPAITELIILEDFGTKTLEFLLVMDVVLSVILFIPLSGFICWIVFLGQVREMNHFCEQFRSGNKNISLSVPLEDPHEEGIITLKRNLQYMARIADQRENSLQYRLIQLHEQCTKFQQLTDIDPLTGLYNRRYFERIVHDYVSKEFPERRNFVLMLMDCDKFKSVNDNLGHAEGDKLLICLGQIIKTSIRENLDYPFRLGGDEFGIILTGVTASSALNVAERIRSNFLQNNNIGSSLSIGIIEGCYRPAAKWEEMYHQADRAMYLAKQKGGNRIITLDKS
jgi:diguanylate cyclase (GGDEF)-like protein